jgi:hypothetical protein
MALVPGTVTSSFFAIKASEERNLAKDETRRADRNAAEAQRKAKEAEKETYRAEHWKEIAEESLYFAHIGLAHQKWLSAEVGETERFLDACPARFRHWEWGYLNRFCHLDLFTLRGQTREPHGLGSS